MNGVSTHLISSLFPHQTDENIAFMINTQYLGHWKDVLSDNLGSWWKNDGKKTLHSQHLIKFQNKSSIKHEQVPPQNAFVQTDSGNGVNQGKQQI